jgi:hypothetical protein
VRARDFLKQALDNPDLYAVALDALQALGDKDAFAQAEESRKKSQSWRERLFGTRSVTLSGMDDDQWARFASGYQRDQSAFLIGPQIGAARPAYAKALAQQFNYPLHDKDNFESVIQYLTVTYGSSWQKVLVSARDAGHSVAPSPMYELLSHVRARLFVTTDPTDELQRAFTATDREVHTVTRHRINRDELATLGAWQSGLSSAPPPAFVVGWHGFIEDPESLRPPRRVASGWSVEEPISDYVRPPEVLAAIGFTADDSYPRLMRSMLLGAARRIVPGYVPEYGESRDFPLMVIVVTSPEIDDKTSAQRAREYYRQYERFEQTIFYWGTPEEFATELLKRFPMNNAVA